MADGVAARIADALLTYLGESSVGSPALPVSMPDLPFTPPADGKYLRAVFVSNGHGPPLISFTAPDEHRGFLQVSVVWPAADGIIPPMDVAGDVIALFRRGTTVPGDGLKVRIYLTPWAVSPLQDPKEVQVPVLIPWTCVAATPA